MVCEFTPSPKVAVIGFGGTMSSLGASSLDLMDYPEHGRKMDVDEVLQYVPEASQVANVLPVPFRAVGSTTVQIADWFELRDVIHQLAEQHTDLAGVVIMHGTATLEETAFFLNLTLAVPQTVVLVGAQRPMSAVSSDAPMNLINALRVAGSPHARNRGVLVVLNDEIHAARDVVKTDTLRLHSFRSTPAGALGVVDPDGLCFYRRPEGSHAPDTVYRTLPRRNALPRVDILYSYAGADGALIEAAVAHGARGIVSAGLAPGIPARHEVAALEAAMAAGVFVVQCSRAVSGRVAHRLYLQRSGMISGEDFSPQKARILLALSLCLSQDRAQIGAWFQAH